MKPFVQLFSVHSSCPCVSLLYYSDVLLKQNQSLKKKERLLCLITLSVPEMQHVNIRESSLKCLIRGFHIFEMYPSF